jgi:hypothetical protein
MPQISLYIDKDTLSRIERIAHHDRMSISKWVGSNIKTLIDDVYPEGYFSLFGSMNDISIRRPESPGFSNDTRRELL